MNSYNIVGKVFHQASVKQVVSSREDTYVCLITEPEDRIHFMTCQTHYDIIKKNIKIFVDIGLLEKIPQNMRFFLGVKAPLEIPGLVNE